MCLFLSLSHTLSLLGVGRKNEGIYLCHLLFALLCHTSMNLTPSLLLIALVQLMPFTLIPLFQDMILNGLYWQQSFAAARFY
jgi:hypothetical protein